MTDQELRRLAEAASPGPWKWTAKQRVSEMNTGRTVADLRYRHGDADAAYIAAASPDVLLGLLREKEALRKALRGLLPEVMDAEIGSVIDVDTDTAITRIRAKADRWTAVRALLAGERRDG